MKQITFSLVAIGLVLFSWACEKETDTSSQEVLSPAGGLPLLNGHNRIGTIKGFNASNPAATNDSIEARWHDAIHAGMTVGRLQIDWPELEPSPNTYDRMNFEQQLAEMQAQGLQTFLLISAYDSGEPVVPDDLQNKRFDDPEFIQRFKNLMDWVVPLLVAYDGFLLSISNEADNSFGEVPDLDKQILTFLRAIKKHVHQIDEKMAVSVTFSEGSLDYDKAGIYAILDECDVACFNFYGAHAQFTSPLYYKAQTENEIKSDIQRMLDVSGEKKIVIQELGMYAGSITLDSSQEIQRRFFEVFFRAMQEEERLEAAFNFQLVDWSPETTEIFNQVLADEGMPQAFIDQFAESLETIGLIHYENGRRKPAWNEFLSWVTAFEQQAR